MSLPPEVRANYVTIIDSILEKSDLTLVSTKAIRKGIQDAVEYDITPHKAAIKDLTMERFDIFEARQNGDSAPVQSVEAPVAPPVTNGTHKLPEAARITPPSSATPAKREADSEDLSEVVHRSSPKKKRKTSIEDDAALAARLQAEEERLARPTRGGAARRSAPVKKKTPKKKKTSTRIRTSDDSELSDSEVGEEKQHSNSGFHKLLTLSPQLSSLFDGEILLSRPQTTKRIWAYIKANDLQDPQDKRYILCDSKLKEVLRQDRIHMFTMTKVLNEHLYSPDE